MATRSGPLDYAHAQERSHVPLSTEHAYVLTYAHLHSSLHTHTRNPSPNIENLRYITTLSSYLEGPGGLFLIQISIFSFQGCTQQLVLNETVTR